MDTVVEGFKFFGAGLTTVKEILFLFFGHKAKKVVAELSMDASSHLKRWLTNCHSAPDDMLHLLLLLLMRKILTRLQQSA